MKLLRELIQPNYPTDYLVARIKGRKTDLIRNWQPYIEDPDKISSTSDAAIWGKFIDELHWLYAQMNSQLRFFFNRVITYFELRTFFLCLRFLDGGQKKTAIELLEKSLINHNVKKLFEKRINSSDLVRKLLIQMKISSGASKELENAYRNEGLRYFENLFYRKFLTDTMGVKSHRVVKSFFKDLIAVRNAMSQAKHIRWRHTERPDLIPGGSKIEKHSLFEHNESPTAEILKGNLQLLETNLLADLTRKVQRSSRIMGNISVIIDYLWMRYIETVNLGIVLHGQNISPDRITQELVQ